MGGPASILHCELSHCGTVTSGMIPPGGVDDSSLVLTLLGLDPALAELECLLEVDWINMPGLLVVKEKGGEAHGTGKESDY